MRVAVDPAQIVAGDDDALSGIGATVTVAKLLETPQGFAPVTV
jgi:hypothetical protein